MRHIQANISEAEWQLADAVFRQAGWFTYVEDYIGFRSEGDVLYFILADDARQASHGELEKAAYRWGQLTASYDRATLTVSLPCDREYVAVFLYGQTMIAQVEQPVDMDGVKTARVSVPAGLAKFSVAIAPLNRQFQAAVIIGDSLPPPA